MFIQSLKTKHLNTITNYIITMVTTIQISKELLNELKERKFYGKESYEEVIWDLIEDMQEVNEETKKEIELSRKQIKEGKVHTLESLKKDIGT